LKFIDHLLGRRSPLPSRRPLPATPSDARIATIIDDALASAGLGRETSRGGGIAAVIDDALERAGLRGAPDATRPKMPIRTQPQSQPPLPSLQDARAPATPAQGQFLSRSFVGVAGALDYKLYLPAGCDADASRQFPLLVMLHGCTQSPDDFAAGTRMNALADSHGFLVAYPAQSANANASKCWNWFRPQDQARGSGEPALIAGMTAKLQSDYPVDPGRTYVAGLSAGAAMAVVLGRTYPDVFAAVGAHSGLPYRAAHDMGSAFGAMKAGAAKPADAGAAALVPTIVFHGDRDHTVSSANGAAIVAQASGADGALEASTHETGIASGGRRYTRTNYRDASGQTMVEDWRVHGAGHAWMGGSTAGTYTDPQGPDASAEMLRFFLQHAR
jgi:poly(hydroxyalkanoate) depolymerase family esterase